LSLSKSISEKKFTLSNKLSKFFSIFFWISKNSLKSFDKPNLFQKYPEQTAEYDYLIKRNLRNQASTNTKAAEIYQNSRYLPYDTKRETFVYDDLMPGIYYYNPEQKVFVTRVPDTETEEGGLFKVNPYNFTMEKLPN